jgi:hypothetical protein
MTSGKVTTLVDPIGLSDFALGKLNAADCAAEFKKVVFTLTPTFFVETIQDGSQLVF